MHISLLKDIRQEILPIFFSFDSGAQQLYERCFQRSNVKKTLLGEFLPSLYGRFDWLLHVIVEVIRFRTVV